MQASELTALMTSSSADVLDSMYFTSVLAAAIEAELPADFADCVSYQLNFRGNVSGVFGLSVQAPAALVMAANFLGEEESDLSATEVAEVIGELANILCGSLVSGIVSEEKFVLSHPMPIECPVPADVSRAASTDRVALKLETDSGLVSVWIVLNQDACTR